MSLGASLNRLKRLPGLAKLAGTPGGLALGTEPDETCEEGAPPAGDATAASAAWTADTLKDSAVAAAAVRATRRRDKDSTMYMTI